MGLSEPRKRLKISHDPRNLAWASATGASTSVGHRLMKSQGWSEGQALGTRTPSTHSSGTSTPTTADDNARLAAARVGVLFKDDTLGLGARLKSRDVEGQKTGLDAFQGLLGRLNSKTVDEEKAHDRKMENQKLEGYAKGRWGGMMFVPGGVLVQGEAFKSKKEAMEAEQKREEEESADSKKEAEVPEDAVADTQEHDQGDKAERRRRKEERRQRKEDRRAGKAAKSAKKAKKVQPHLTINNQKPSKRKSRSISAPDEATSSSSDDSTPPAESTIPPDSNKSRRHPSITITETKKTEILRNGRHILRGRDIEAKRKAFSDMKGLDAIFMK